MKLTKCSQNHYYDADKYETCPHCNSQSNGQLTDSIPPIISDFPGNDTGNGTLGDEVEDVQKTVGIFSKKAEKEPVVGWLVCIEGEHCGEDFRIKMGRNFVGRSTNMDVVLSKDAHVSREKHAIIVYEPKGNMFIIQAGESKELSYLNDTVVLSPRELNPYDIISLGTSKLMFVPFCSDKFTWDNDEESEDK